MTERQKIAQYIIAHFAEMLGSYDHIRRYVFYHASTASLFQKLFAEIDSDERFAELRSKAENLQAKREALHINCLAFIVYLFRLPENELKIPGIEKFDLYIWTEWSSLNREQETKVKAVRIV